MTPLLLEYGRHLMPPNRLEATSARVAMLIFILAASYRFIMHRMSILIIVRTPEGTSTLMPEMLHFTTKDCRFQITMAENIP